MRPLLYVYDLQRPVYAQHLRYFGVVLEAAFYQHLVVAPFDSLYPFFPLAKPTGGRPHLNAAPLGGGVLVVDIVGVCHFVAYVLQPLVQVCQILCKLVNELKPLLDVSRPRYAFYESGVA